MLDAGAVIAKYRSKGALIDSNLLVLFLVGSIKKSRILGFKRTQDFTIAGFILLKNLINSFGKLFVTPHVRTQVSDLCDLSGRELRALD